MEDNDRRQEKNKRQRSRQIGGDGGVVGLVEVEDNEKLNEMGLEAIIDRTAVFKYRSGPPGAC